MLDGIDNWDKLSHPMQRDEFGVYSINLPNKLDGSPAIEHNSKVKASHHHSYAPFSFSYFLCQF